MSVGLHKLMANEMVVCAELDGESVLLDVVSGVYYGLDEVGSRIWRLLVEGADREGIVEQILAEYDVEPERLRSDVDSFLESMVAKGLVLEASE